MASPTQWTWVWVSSGRWWRTEKPWMLQSMGSQRVRQDWMKEQQVDFTTRDIIEIRRDVTVKGSILQEETIILNSLHLTPRFWLLGPSWCWLPLNLKTQLEMLYPGQCLLFLPKQWCRKDNYSWDKKICFHFPLVMQQMQSEINKHLYSLYSLNLRKTTHFNIEKANQNVPR